jgi:hypothetical protein
VSKIVDKIGEQRWPVVWSGKYYLILENPNYREYEKSDGN